MISCQQKFKDKLSSYVSSIPELPSVRGYTSHNNNSLLNGGWGGGGGFTLFFVVKLNFEIAVDQQTKAHDETFEGVQDSGCRPVPAGQPRPYLVNFWLNFAKSL